MIIRRMLIANRGEIAVRIVRTCRRLGIETVLSVSDADTRSLPARLADATVRIVPHASRVPPPAASYLDVDAVVSAAVAAGVDAVHPGYGFLAENPELALACTKARNVFVGPTADKPAAVGDKHAAPGPASAGGPPPVPAPRNTVARGA